MGPKQGQVMGKSNSMMSVHDEALLTALEQARVATVNVVRFSGYMSPQVVVGAERLLMEIGGLLAEIRAMSVLGEADDEAPREAVPSGILERERSPVPIQITGRDN